MRDKAVDWEAVREVWEQETNRPGWLWLKEQLDLSVSVQAIRQHAVKHQWAKRQCHMTALYGPTISAGSQYRQGFEPAAAKLALLGFSQADIAAHFSVTPEQLAEWMQAHHALFDAIHKGSALADAEIAHALHRAATGYDQEEQHIGTDEQGKPSAITITKHYPPDAELARWWQENRNAKKHD